MFDRSMLMSLHVEQARFDEKEEACLCQRWRAAMDLPIDDAHSCHRRDNIAATAPTSPVSNSTMVTSDSRDWP
jgi:hypothetical protein